MSDHRSLLEARGVTKIYGALTALDGVDLSVRDNEFHGLIGPNGSGKSTLLKSIQHLIEIPADTVRIGGIDVTAVDLDDLRRRVGYVPQDDFLFSTTVFDNIAYGKPEAAAKEVEGAAFAAGLSDELSGLADGLRTVVGERGATLSGGQRQRVAIARALVNRPKLVLADEPTGNLDPDLTIEIMDLIVKASTRGTTVMVATHDHSLIERYGKRVLRLEGGRIVEDIPAAGASIGAAP